MSMRVAFTASEYQHDGSIARVPYELSGTPAAGWSVVRAGVEHVRLGPGYRLLQVSHCGVCATDLARRYLPFRLPQITGHEVVAVEEDGTPVVVEINASPRASVRVVRVLRRWTALALPGPWYSAFTTCRAASVRGCSRRSHPALPAAYRLESGASSSRSRPRCMRRGYDGCRAGGSRCWGRDGGVLVIAALAAWRDARVRHTRSSRWRGVRSRRTGDG